MVVPRAPEQTQQDQDEEMLVPHQDAIEGLQKDVLEGPQPMEEFASAVENQIIPDTSTSRFTWYIENFSKRNVRKHYSDDFTVGGYKWRVLVFPRGNNVDYLSMYLDVADSNLMPPGWSRNAQFSLAVVNQLDSKASLRKEATHQFNSRESDWGFTSFMPLLDLYDSSKGYVVNDKCIIEAEVAVRKTLDFWNYDSKRMTGYVGLKNQGATCYMNSLLQTLYHIPYFRKAVYHMPTTENDTPSGNIPLALQSLFYKLQHSDNSVATKELTKSFGWDSYDSFMQHDVQELNRVLCEKLENKMKGTTVEGAIQKLFEGHHMNYIECINVESKSTRKESFYDLALDVKGCSDVYASFDKYVAVERLEGDNKYQSEEHGLQDAKKGMLFIDFPPVLQLQLKRFEYDFVRDTMLKINDRYEFPLQLDLDRDDGKYLSPDADRSVRNLYTLHSVLVHSGGVHGGHYYAFIRPKLSDQWYKFEDERVTKEDMKRALEEQYGGEEELPHTNPGLDTAPLRFTKHSNAYMLVYIRESDKDNIICDLDDEDISEHLKVRLRKEHEEKEYKKKEKAEAHMFTALKVARDFDIKEQIGRHMHFDLVDFDRVNSFRAPKNMSINEVKEELSKEFGIPVECQRFWVWAKRQNCTYRPSRPLTSQEETSTIGVLKDATVAKLPNSEVRLFLEVHFRQENQPIAPWNTKEDILLFFKLYDPEKEDLRYVGNFFVKASGKPSDIVERLNQIAGFLSDEDIELYEEIKFEPVVMCVPIESNASFRSSQIDNGDIICYQKHCLPDSMDRYRYPTVPSFFEYIHNRQIVHFRLLEKPKEEGFSLELSKCSTYDDVVEKVAKQLRMDDPSKIRLTQHNPSSQQPKPHFIKYRSLNYLSDMLHNHNQMCDILYYDILDIPLPELESMRSLKVAFQNAANHEMSFHIMRLPKSNSLLDLIEDLKSKVEISCNDAEFRFFGVYLHKICKVYQPGDKIDSVNDHGPLYIEEVPEDEKNAGPHDRLVHVYHFEYNHHIQYFGEPFFFLIRDGEALSDMKVRIQKRLQVPDEQFLKWKFAHVTFSKPEYLQDSDIVMNRFHKQRPVYGGWEQHLGLEHTATTPKRSYLGNNQSNYRTAILLRSL
ncbi:ubiquitin carboxyl-terminal hydrolase 13 isoform X3 [Zea mays]|uniref:ubiquitin carboxyl-terminal hydrolase 13 isoform X3 n=1 Tax=Zea mays TaxID=4577 RepID=UPI000C6C408A|nr:ubiquitin carboxyl-terminal hydrolase 13 isoform X3 [Zea mays]|eukprot:XP_023157799.1 ubiquitin carboxyl-terminal hydrolase 13 isoform X3 [Zea mays]